MAGPRLVWRSGKRSWWGWRAGKACGWSRRGWGGRPRRCRGRCGAICRAPRRYRAFPAHIQATARARRSRPRKLAAGSPVRALVCQLLREDIRRAAGQAGAGTTTWPAAAGEPRDDLPGAVRAGQGQPARRGRGRGAVRPGADPAAADGPPARPAPCYPAQISISQRQAEATDRAVPGHWEGDLIIGAHVQSAVATLAERTTRYCMIIALPNGRTADAVSDAVAAHIAAPCPPPCAARSPGTRAPIMATHAAFSVATGVPVYFADPHSPLAARHQREHQRPDPLLPAQRHRPVSPHPGHLTPSPTSSTPAPRTLPPPPPHPLPPSRP